MMKKFSTYETLCKLPLGRSLWGLLFFIIFLSSCSNDVAEVNTPLHEEQYVTVRMNIPGMQSTISRAAEDNITSITALSYDSNNKLTKKVSATNLNTENQTFNITVPNGTKNIHFLANNNVSLPEIGTDVSALTSLTTTDYNNLVYWGMATTSHGNTEPLSVTLYRNLAKISIKPSVGEDAVFNDFTQEQLIISGLMNPNRVGKLVPYKDESFYSNQNGTAPDYCTLPDNPDPLDKTPIGNDGAGYGYSLYVLEHDNPKDLNNGLFVICNIGGAYYKVALVDANGEPYDIIRNHEYIIYVSDVDDYAYDTDYRADKYSDAFDKKPINLDVEEVVLQDVTFSPTGQQIVQMGNTLSITMYVPEGTILNNFSISTDGFTFDTPSSSYSGGTTTSFTFTPKSVGIHYITFTGSGENLNEVNTTINVTVQDVEKKELQYSYGSTTLYMKDSNGEANPTSLAVEVTVPDGSTLNSLIIAAPGFIIKNGELQLVDGGTYTDNTERAANSTVTYTFTPKVDATDYTITFSSTDTDLIATKVIDVTVKNENAPSEIVLWEEDIIVSWTPFELVDERLKDASEITFDVEASDDDERQIQLNMPGYLYISKESLPKNEKVTLTVSTTQSSMAPDGTLKITGQNVTITKIYIIPTSAE